MTRLIMGALAGAIAWFVVIAALGVVARFAWPEMAEIRDMSMLTFPMLVTRLSISAIGSVLSGALAAMIARDAFKASLAAGVLLLIIFVPYHLTIWIDFPIWYHLTFFASLPLLSLLGGRLTGKKVATATA
jgi:hypothetical protein